MGYFSYYADEALDDAGTCLKPPFLDGNSTFTTDTAINNLAAIN